jgi:hypothetical protein
MEIKCVCRPGEKAANEEEPLRVVSFFSLEKRGFEWLQPHPTANKKNREYTYITGTELREETDGVLKPSSVLPFDVSLPKIICDDCSLFPDEQILQPLLCRGDNPLGNGVCGGVG